MNILVIAPHPDDETIGCGGTLCRCAQRGDRLAVVFLTSGELGLKQLPKAKAWAIREREARAAAKVLGVSDLVFLRQPDWFVGEHIPAAARSLAPMLQQRQPELVLLPHEHDEHPDHRAALPLLRAGLKRAHLPKPEVFAYEVWTPLARHDWVEDITPVMSRKMRALRAHRSQLKEFNYERAVRGLNAFRGELAARCRYAEVFQSVVI